MVLSRTIRNRVNRIRNLQLFSTEAIRQSNESLFAVSKELSRMIERGELRRYSKGVYYKPELSQFGELKPSTNDVLRFLMYDGNKRIGYVTGARTHNYLGISTQIPDTVTIATNRQKRSGKFGRVMIQYVKCYANPNEKNIPLLQVLDTIKDIGKIQDSSTYNSIEILSKIIKDIPLNEKRLLLGLVKNYPPRVVALTGYILENISHHKETKLEDLKQSIAGKGKFLINSKKLPFGNNENWNIHASA